MKAKAEENATQPPKLLEQNCNKQVKTDKEDFIQVHCNGEGRLNATPLK